MSRVYDTDVPDLWDAVTSPERIARWFLPVSGRLELGGHFQVECLAGGEILLCEAPRRLEVTWCSGEFESWVDLQLSDEVGGRARLELSHTDYLEMNAFEVIADPVRREILEVLAEGERAAGEVAALVVRKFGITQAAVSQHLSVPKEAGFANMRPDGIRRLYSIEVSGLREVDSWFERFRTLWELRLEALGKEIERGKNDRAEGRHG